MRLLLDTCVVSELRKANTPAETEDTLRVTDRIGSENPADLYVSAMTYGEIRRGIEKLRASRRKRDLEAWARRVVVTYGRRLLPLDADVFEHWGRICAATERRGKKMPLVDSLIAATAARHGLTVATRNVDDFGASGVPILDPWDA